MPTNIERYKIEWNTHSSGLQVWWASHEIFRSKFIFFSF